MGKLTKAERAYLRKIQRPVDPEDGLYVKPKEWGNPVMQSLREKGLLEYLRLSVRVRGVRITEAGRAALQERS